MPSRKRKHLDPVASRHVVHINGFEPVSPERLDSRMQSGLKKYAALWDVAIDAQPKTVGENGRSVRWIVDAKGSNWRTRCDYTVLRWDDLMMPYVERPWPMRMWRGFGALFEFIRTGTMRRYFKANLRYGLFTLYPLLALAAFFLMALGFAGLLLLFGIPAPAVVAPLGGLVVFLLLLRFVGGYIHLDFALADWSFAADVARRDVPGLDAIIDHYAEVVREAIEDEQADEVLLSSVSLGSMMLVEALAVAFDRDPDLKNRAKRAAFLTVGSSIMKIGLHPAADALRQRVNRIGTETSLFWAEYQAKVDPINFYKTDPVADLGFARTGRPIVKLIRIRDMMTADAYRRAERKLLYLHRQFVMPNGQRYGYDFYQVAFGPMRLKDRAGLGPKAAAAFGKDGRFKRRRSRGKASAKSAAGDS